MRSTVNLQGLHADDIASKNGTEGRHTGASSTFMIIWWFESTPVCLARILRYLATRHMFREVSPDVFTNNRVSSTLIKQGKTMADIQAK